MYCSNLALLGCTDRSYPETGAKEHACDAWLFGNFRLFGLGLWNHPQAAALVELIFVIAGATMYWRGAMEVSTKAGRNGKLASLSAAMIATFGILVLFLGYTS